MTLQEFFARDDSWCQRAERDGEKRCIFGALKDCLGYSTDKFHCANMKLLTLIHPWNSTGAWNDAPGRTIADVRELVRKAGV